jgi:hypothetical protein
MQVDQGARLFEATAEFERNPTCGLAFLLLTFLWRSKEK